MVGITQVQLAKRAGVSPVAIKKIENGVLKVSDSMAIRLAMATGLDPKEIVENVEPGIWPNWPVLAYRGEIARRLNLEAINRMRGLPRDHKAMTSEELAARILRLQEASLDCGNGGKRSVNRQRGPSVRRSH
jgi:DNA-binding XRE family transcriptional regulator